MSTSFKPMLAKDAALDKIAFPLLVQPKLDGIRASVVNGKLVSRTLKPIPNAEVRAALEGRPELEGLDGELIVGDPRDPACYRTTSSFVMSGSKTGAPWVFYVFDKWDSTQPDGARRDEVVAQVKLAAEPRIEVVATMLAESADELERMEALIVGEGHEGVIARVPSGTYKFGRSTSRGPLLKIKRFIDFEAEVIGVYEEQHNGNEAKTNALGRTERSTAKAGKVGKGTLGGLIVRAINGPAEGVEFRVGTGFDAQQRADLWNDYDDGNGLNGRVAKVKSFPIGVKDKPRHPVFLGWRDMSVDG